MKIRYIKAVYSKRKAVIQEVTNLEVKINFATMDLNTMQKLTIRFFNYLKSEELWNLIIMISFKITLILIASYLVVKIGNKLIEKFFTIRMRTPLTYSERRQRTILKLLQNVLAYLVYFSSIVGILSLLNIQVMGLLAGAGIASVAIAFGAQSLVKDIITGFFIVFEDQFGVGDYIKLNGAEGTVAEIGLRTTKIKGASGEQHIIPNGSIGAVINYSVNDTSTYIDFVVPSTADIVEIEQKVESYLKPLAEQHEELTKMPLLMGVQNFTPDAVTMRIKIETTSMEHSKMARIIRRDLLALLEAYGVKVE